MKDKNEYSLGLDAKTGEYLLWRVWSTDQLAPGETASGTDHWRLGRADALEIAAAILAAEARRAREVQP